MARLLVHQEHRVHKSITSRTYERLRNAIIMARYRPGEKLGIDALKVDLDASLGAVREALAALSSEGLVRAEPQRGFSVSLISRQDLVDLTEARMSIELTCLESAITHGDLDWESRVLASGHRLAKLTHSLDETVPEDVLLWHRTHEAFHNEIASACTNQWWLKLRRQLFVQSERYRCLSGPIANPNRDIEAEHDRIAKAAIARDTDTAKSLMRDHLQTTAEILLNSKLSIWEGSQ
ncbi:FCD domain-containing protein [Fertoebacter nigrum]|uniref:FCD domain-containing protein n=1 Tax=Fertoeibacter niger TaxID=2656921 RepID=A0A8X8H692_9RHOB|nr:FCD domain-containing protein [Fertoeibacter niger]